MATASPSVWTQEHAERVAQVYADAPTPETVESLAAELGRSSRSIIAKLSKAGLYVKPPKRTKSGEVVESKEDKVERIAALLMVKPDRVRGLEFANKSTLDLIAGALAKAQVADAADAAE